MKGAATQNMTYGGDDASFVGWSSVIGKTTVAVHVDHSSIAALSGL
jgi:hypothetical protein